MSTLVSDQLEMIQEEICRCRKCMLHKNIVNYVPGTIGLTKPNLIFIAQSPNREEDLLGEPFMGRDGKILRDKIEYFFKVKRNDYSIFLSVCCKVIKDKHDKVHRPTYHQRDMCKPYIIEKLKLLTYYGDLTIITLGMDALISVTDYEGSLINCRNYYFTTEFNGRKITCLPTVLPYTSRSNDKVKGAMERDFKSFYGELYKFERKEVEFYLS